MNKNSKAELFSKICDINTRLKSYYKSKFVEFSKGEPVDDKKKSAYYIYQLLDALEELKEENEELKERLKELN